MGRLYLVRHGTHALQGKVLTGRMAGVRLSEYGRAQAEEVAAFFSGLSGIETVVSSPMERCRETAAPIAKQLGLAVVANDALDEIDCGAWTGRSFDDLAADPRWRMWNSDRSHAVVPGGEGAEALRARVMSFVESHAVPYRAPSVAVTHGDIIKTVALTLLGASLDLHDRLEIEPASITTIDLWAGGGKIVRLNQVAP